MRARALVAGSALACTLVAARVGRADADGDAADAVTIQDAEKTFSAASNAFAAAGADCTTRCKALASMQRAAEKICELAKDGTADDQARCAAAKRKVEDARETLRAACPQCVSDEPPPSVAVPPRPPTDKKDEGIPTTMPAPPPPAAMTMISESAGAAARSVTLKTSVVYPFLTRFIGRVGVEAAIDEHVSLGVSLGGGAYPGVSAAADVGAEVRGYVLGSFSRGGLAIGVQLLERVVGKTTDTCAVDCPAHDVAETFAVPGESATPFLALKTVFPSGLTLEALAGAGVVLHHQKVVGATDGDRKVVPLIDLSIGWSF